jgi:hypothetical protein
MIRSIRFFAVLPLLLLLVATLPLAQAQTNPTTGSSLTTTTLLENASQAFSKGQPVHSVTLSGTANWIVGGDNENGNITLIANSDGSYQINLEMGQSSRTETQTAFAQGPQCTWAGTDGVAQVVSGHNCMQSVAWFLPEVALFGNLQPQAVGTLLVGSSANAQTPGLDLRQQQSVVPNYVSANIASLYTHLSAVDIFYNPTAYLPLSVAYETHPDGNATLDIPVQVEFSNYQTVGGITVPFHIQRYVNGVLALDITVSNVSWS